MTAGIKAMTWRSRAQRTRIQMRGIPAMRREWDVRKQEKVSEMAAMMSGVMSFFTATINQNMSTNRIVAFSKIFFQLFNPNYPFFQALPVSLVYQGQLVQTTVRTSITIHIIQIGGLQEVDIILMNQTKNWTKRDQFRTQYAVLAKHVLCQRSKLKLYQIERSMHNTKKLAAAQGNLLMMTSLAQNIKRDIVERAIDLGNKFMQTVYFQGVIYGAPIVGITINAALAIHEYKHPESKPTLNCVISENLISEEENKIESFLQAYLKSYQNQENFSQFVERSCIIDDDQSNDFIDCFKPVSFIHPLMEKKNYICKAICGEQFKSFEIHKKVRMAELYYQLVKALIEIVGLSQNKNIVKFLSDLKHEHLQIKNIMIASIRRAIRRWGQTITIQGVTRVEISDPFYLCNEQEFAESIFDEIFRCPATKFTVDCIYLKDCWTDEHRQEMKVGVQESAIFKHLGQPLRKYDTRKYECTSRIRRMQSDKSGDWACFYQNVKNKAGSYDENWSHHKVYIDFDSAKVIYLNSQKLCMLNSQYQSIQIHDGYELPEYTDSLNSCFELSQEEDLLYIQFAGMMDLRFMFVKKSEQQLQYKQTCNGSIETKDRKFRLAYKPKSLLSFNFVNAYDFQARDIEDPCQMLIFQAITPISFFPNSGQIQSFTCRITNQYDKSHFMIRKSRESEYGQFETNQFGEQLISVTLLEKLSTKNEYIGTMKVIGCPIYLTQHIQMMWEKKNSHSEAVERFYIYFNQK